MKATEKTWYIIPSLGCYGVVEIGQQFDCIHTDLETFTNEEGYNNRLLELEIS